MKNLMTAALFSLLVTFSLSAAEAPRSAPEVVATDSLEALLNPQTPIALATLYRCDVWCLSGAQTSANTATASICANFARKFCRPDDCDWEFNNSVLGIC